VPPIPVSGSPVPALLSFLIDVPPGGLPAVLVADGAPRRCLREWLAVVPDPRSRLGRWHPLEFVLALAVCAFTAAGHDSPSAVADWASGCSQETLAVLGGRRDPWAGLIRPPGERTFRRVFGRVDAGALNEALYGYLAALPAGSPEALPAVTRHEREQRRAAVESGKPAVAGLLEQAAADGKAVRGAVRSDGSQAHLLSVFQVTGGCTLAQREVDAKTNEAGALSSGAPYPPFPWASRHVAF
jgi:DDE_Tnp_1-associated